MELIETKVVKKRQINPDRIVLEGKSLEFVRKVADQIEQSFGGIIKLTNKEIANFILQSRCDLLSGAELKAIKDRYFDDVRAAQWAVQKLKAAKDGGQSLTLADVIGQLQTPVVKEKRRRNSTKERSIASKTKDAQVTIEIEK